MVHVFTCILALAIGCFVIYSSFEQIKKYPIVAVSIALLLALALGVYLYKNSEVYQSLLIPLFELTIKQDTQGLPETMTMVNSFGFSVCLLLTLASCSVLYPASTLSIQDLSLRMRNLKLILYVGTFMLITGVFLIQSMYHWAVTFIAQDAEIINNANSFFTTLLSAEGGYFTLTLAVVHLPAAYILQRQADVRIESENDETVRLEMQKKYNFNFSFLESLPR